MGFGIEILIGKLKSSMCFGRKMALAMSCQVSDPLIKLLSNWIFVFPVPADGVELAAEQGCCYFRRLCILSIIAEKKVKTAIQDLGCGR